MTLSRLRRGARLRWTGRACCFAGALALLGGFSLSIRLPPDPQGFGTHRQLGLPPCTFQQLSGWPCPSCGMTTSFSHFVRGQWIRSLRANSAGWLLACLCAGLVPWLLVSGATGRLVGVERPLEAAAAVLCTFLAVALLNWIGLLVVWSQRTSPPPSAAPRLSLASPLFGQDV